MLFSRPAALLAGVAATVSASPVKRAATSALTDVDILNYALTLEHLEGTFYRQGLGNYSESDFAAAGYSSDDYQNLQQVLIDEGTHVQFLTSAIQAAGGTPVQECTYDFGVSDVNSFLALAAVLEGVGVTAYLGAAGDIMSKTYLGAAGSILTTEARHSAYLRSLQGRVPVAQPFDDALDPNEVYTLAAPFFVDCPVNNPTLPVKAFPFLAVDESSAKQNLTSGGTVTVDTMGYSLKPTTPGAQMHAAFISSSGPLFTNVTDASNGNGTKYTVQIPDGINGQSYLVLTGCNETVNDDTVAAGPVILEITNSAPYNGSAPASAYGSANATGCSTSGFNATLPNGTVVGGGSSSSASASSGSPSSTSSGMGGSPSGSASSSGVSASASVSPTNAGATVGVSSWSSALTAMGALILASAL